MSIPTSSRRLDRWLGRAAAALLLVAVLTLATIGVAMAGPGGQPAPERQGPQPVRSAAIDGKDPVPITGALTARVTGMAPVHGVARQPGEIAGPAVRFSIRITNSTSGPVDLSKTVVNAYYGADRTPAGALLGPGGAAFPATLAAGRAATGSFIFTVPPAGRRTVEVTVDTSVTNPVVAFRGSAPR